MLIAKAPTLTVLVACPDANGVLRFPTADGPYIGIPLRIDQTLAISKQAAKKVADFLGKPDLEKELEPLSIIEPILRSEGQDPSLLFLMRAPKAAVDAAPSWKRIIDILRELPQGSNRVAYNKALQYFAGAGDVEIDILEVDGEVKQRIRELMGESGHSLLS
jgi:hypothetical protein